MKVPFAALNAPKATFTADEHPPTPHPSHVMKVPLRTFNVPKGTFVALPARPTAPPCPAAMP
ncbi:hypothetical protein GCM10010174_15360 [Kutzneria viridogrisea]|uniref:Uncharacterized protein n=1 Tax=Kutzneria viridogrisea TaxID=47990 RepID=A0ABR6BGV1_9PSEU|nr:hypothetical protein [Kutzneria viridogrisea]